MKLTCEEIKTLIEWGNCCDFPDAEDEKLLNKLNEELISRERSL